MDCFVLGSGGMMPMPRRRLTSVALRQQGEVYLFDTESHVMLRGAANPIAVAIPCHRVVGSDGRLTGYGGGLWRKQRLLDLEREHRPTSPQ